MSLEEQHAAEVARIRHDAAHTAAEQQRLKGRLAQLAPQIERAEGAEGVNPNPNPSPSPSPSPNPNPSPSPSPNPHQVARPTSRRRARARRTPRSGWRSGWRSC